MPEAMPESGAHPGDAGSTEGRTAKGAGGPPPGCRRCARLAAFRDANRARHSDFFNAPVPSFGPCPAPVLVVGLAPGLRGANRTGRPFTGDWAGDLLYPGLIRAGLAAGAYGATPADGLTMIGCRVTNAVRCVPPENRPTTDEIRRCNGFLAAEIAACAPVAVFALGGVAHGAVLRALGRVQARHPFGHGAVHALESLALIDSYHCSRYNTNTGRLTLAMFDAVLAALAAAAKGGDPAAAAARARAVLAAG